MNIKSNVLFLINDNIPWREWTRNEKTLAVRIKTFKIVNLLYCMEMIYVDLINWYHFEYILIIIDVMLFSKTNKFPSKSFQQIFLNKKFLFHFLFLPMSLSAKINSHEIWGIATSTNINSREIYNSSVGLQPRKFLPIK